MDGARSGHRPGKDVDGARGAKVDGARAAEQVPVLDVRQPSVRGLDPVGHDGVEEESDVDLGGGEGEGIESKAGERSRRLLGPLFLRRRSRGRAVRDIPSASTPCRRLAQDSTLHKTSKILPKQSQ